MGYKMKGSPAKLGSIQGTAGHASALKMAASPARHVDSIDTGSNRGKNHADAHNKRHANGDSHGEIGSKGNKWTKKKDSSEAVSEAVTRKTVKKATIKKAPTKAKTTASPVKINLIKMATKKIVKKVGKIMPKKGAAPAGAAPAGAAPAAAPAIEPKGVSAPAPTKMYKKSPAKGADPDSFLGVMESSTKGKLDPAPTKFWATVAKVAIGANKKRNAQKQARDDAKNKGVQDAMSKGPSKF